MYKNICTLFIVLYNIIIKHINRTIFSLNAHSFFFFLFYQLSFVDIYNISFFFINLFLCTSFLLL